MRAELTQELRRRRRVRRRESPLALRRTDKPAFCFQGHPEASPGPADVAYLFDRFIGMMQAQENK